MYNNYIAGDQISANYKKEQQTLGVGYNFLVEIRTLLSFFPWLIGYKISDTSVTLNKQRDEIFFEVHSISSKKEHFG